MLYNEQVHRGRNQLGKLALIINIDHNARAEKVGFVKSAKRRVSSGS